jgi:hypothetical protein
VKGDLRRTLASPLTSLAGTRRRSVSPGRIPHCSSHTALNAGSIYSDAADIYRQARARRWSPRTKHPCFHPVSASVPERDQRAAGILAIPSGGAGMRSPRPIGLLDHRAAAAAAYRLRSSEHAAVGEQLDAGGGADLTGRREPVTVLRRKRLPPAVSRRTRARPRWPSWLARGAAMACGSVAPRSSRSRRICSTTVMMVEPPGETSASSGWPSSSTIVGLIELRGRLPPSTRFG